MENQKLYSVYDKKCNTYSRPAMATHIQQMARALTNIVNDNTHAWGQFTAEYELYHMGDFNEETGELIPREKPHFIMNLQELKIQPGE